MILGCDIGYGDVKVVISDKGKIVKLFKFSSAIAKAKKVSAIRDARIFELETLDGLENIYAGEDALSLPSSDIIDITDYGTLEKYAPVFIAKALQLADIQPEQISVVVSGLSVSQLNQSGYFKERIAKFVCNNKEYKFEKVFLLPQGAGSKLAFDKYGTEFPNSRTSVGSDTFVGCDIGFNTVDMFYVTNGKTSPNLFEGIEREGVMRIAQMVQQEVKARFEKDISLREAKEILDSKVYKLRGEMYDMKEVCDVAVGEYYKRIFVLIEDRYGPIIDKCDYICLLGGGAKLCTKEDQFIKVVQNKAEFYNAIGFTLYGENK